MWFRWYIVWIGVMGNGFMSFLPLWFVSNLDNITHINHTVIDFKKSCWTKCIYMMRCYVTPNQFSLFFYSFEKQLQQHQQYMHARIDIWHFHLVLIDLALWLIDWLIDWLLQLIMSNGGMVFLRFGKTQNSCWQNSRFPRSSLLAYAIAIVSMTNQHNTTNSNLLCSIP